jgi:hypothetical protein
VRFFDIPRKQESAAADTLRRIAMKKLAVVLLVAVPITVLLFFAAMNPPEVAAVPSYARQTGLACSGCHYAPPELNPAGRRFKLTGYVDKADETKVITTDGGKKRAALDLLSSLPLSVMLETSFTSLKSPLPDTSSTSTPLPTTQNGSFELPQDISLFLAGRWTSNIGSFLQVTYDTQDDHFTSDNTDIRFANKTKLGGRELVYGLDLNNNPTVEDLWNSTPAWGFPWIASDFAPTPAASPIINGGLAQDVAGFGGFAMWDNHIYLDAAVYRSAHVGGQQPFPEDGSTNNIRGVSPYWRLAFQELTAKTQYEIGTYGMHARMSTTPGTLQDEYTDVAFDTQIDRTLFRTDVLSFRGTYIRENSDLLASGFGSNHLNTVMANAEYHLGNKYTSTVGVFNTGGNVNPGLYGPAPVSGSANGDPRGAGYLLNFSYWPWQNLQLAAQYTAYTRFNGASTNYDGSGRNANANNTVYLDAKIIF